MRVILDGEQIRYRGQIHQLLAQQLRFPPWYGHNLDALYDCLTALRQDAELVLVHWTQPELQIVRQVLEDAAEENPHLTVTVE